MYVDASTIATAGAVLAAVIAFLSNYNKAHKWILKQEQQDSDIAAIKEEQTLMTYGLLACLKGLKEQGCNGPVTDAINRIEKHMNRKAHE